MIQTRSREVQVRPPTMTTSTASAVGDLLIPIMPRRRLAGYSTPHAARAHRDLHRPLRARVYRHKGSQIATAWLYGDVVIFSTRSRAMRWWPRPRAARPRPSDGRHAFRACL